MVLLAVNALCPIMVPELEEVQMEQCVIVPQVEPVAAVNVTTLLDVAVFPDTVKVMLCLA